MYTHVHVYGIGQKGSEPHVNSLQVFVSSLCLRLGCELCEGSYTMLATHLQTARKLHFARLISYTSHAVHTSLTSQPGSSKFALEKCEWQHHAKTQSCLWMCVHEGTNMFANASLVNFVFMCLQRLRDAYFTNYSWSIATISLHFWQVPYMYSTCILRWY